MDVFEALATRRSASAFSEDRPPREMIARLLEAATWAPNHHLTEPWRFVVIAGDERKRFGDRLAAWFESSDDGSGWTASQIESMRRKLLRSTVIVVVIQNGSPKDPVRDREDYAACSCATQNLLLAAHAEGLAAKWSTGQLVTLPAARDYLDLEEADRIVAYVYLGYPSTTEQPAAASRRPADTSWRGFEG